MFQKDFVLRLIEQLAKVVTEVLGLKKKQKYEQALSIIDQSFQQFLGFNSKLINSFSYQELIEMMRLNQALCAAKCIVLAELLKEEADVYSLQGNFEKSSRRYNKSLNIFFWALKDNAKLDSKKYFLKVEAIVECLRQDQLEAETGYNLFKYYERVGRFGKAEDLIFDFLEKEKGFSQAQIVDLGLAFYQRLLKKKDDQLIKGNLPRDEVKQGQAELKAFRARVDSEES